MSQVIVNNRANPKRANLKAIQQGGTLADLVLEKDDILLISKTNEIFENGNGFFEYYILGDGITKASELTLVDYCYLHQINVDKYLFAISDKEGNVVYGICKDGSLYQPKGIPEESKILFNQIAENLDFLNDKIRTINNGGKYLYAIVDKNDNVVSGIKLDGSLYQPKGIPEESKVLFNKILDNLKFYNDKFSEINLDKYLYSVVDKDKNFLFGIDKSGEFITEKGHKIGNVELKEVNNEKIDTLFHILDKNKNVIMRLDKNGVPHFNKGIVLDGKNSGVSYLDNKDWLFVITDSKERFIGGIDKDGAFHQNSIKGVFEAKQVNHNKYIYYVLDKNDNVVFGITKEGIPEFPYSDALNSLKITNNKEFLFVIKDKNGFVLWGIRNDGSFYQPKGISNECKEILNTLQKEIKDLKENFNNQNIKIDNKAIDKVMLNGNAGRGYLGNVALQEPGMTDYCIIMMYGQSLSNGSENPAGFDDPVVDRCLMLGDNVWNTSGSTLNGLRVGGSVRVDGVATGTRQDTIVSTVNTFVSLYKKERPWDKNTKFIACSLGVGGRTVAQLSGNMYSDKKNTTRRYPMCNEQQLEDRVKPFFQAVKAIADSEGKTISLSAVFWKQGESDYGTGYIDKTYDEWKNIVISKESKDNNAMQGSKDAYKKGLTILKEDIWALAKEIFGDDQQNSPVFLPYSVCGTYINNAYQTINDATYEMANEQDDVIQVGPTYVTPDYEGGHLAMNGYRWFGEYCAKTLYYVFLKHMDFRPLQPYGFDVKDNKVYIYINPIVPPLRIDTYTNDSIYKNYGFSVRMGTVSQLDANKSMTSGGLLQTITNVSIVENCIVLTCGNIEKFEGAIEVSYAGQGESGYGGHNQGAGNVRDSDTWVAKYNYRNDMADHGSRRSFNVWASIRVATESDLTDYEVWNSTTIYAYGDMCLITNTTNGVTYLVKSMKDDNKNLSPFSSGTTWRTAYLWNGSTKATEEELSTLEYWDAAFASSTGYDYGDKVLFDIIEVDGPVVLTSNYGDAAGTVKNKNVPFGRVNYHTTDVKGNMIINKPYPMQNWLLNFYKRIILG